MDLKLEGRLAFVSGSTAGIGFATARKLAKENAIVYVNGRTEERVEEAARKIKEGNQKARVEGIAADLSTDEGCAKVTSELPEADILINNLGIFEPKSFEEITDEDWFRIFEANVMSGVRLTRHYLKGMKQRNRGRIVFVSSESAVQIPGEMIHYGMTKTAQIAVARGIAESLAGSGVTVNSVLAGPTKSEGIVDFMSSLAAQKGITFEEMEDEFFKTARPTSLLKRFITTEEVANLIIYLCGEGASATQGAALRVDGGVVRALL